MTAPRFPSRRTVATLLLVLATVPLTACAGDYALRGRVVRGVLGGVDFVPAEDPRLAEPDVGIASAQISVHRDAGRLSQQLIATGRSSGDGSFTIPLEVFGAGWMQETWLIEVIRPGFETIESFVSLPPAKEDRRTVIVLNPGISRPPERGPDPWADYERFR